jgi:hypothetical protein
MNEETTFHEVCQEVLDWKETLHEFELMIDEIDLWEHGYEKERYEDLKKNTKRRIEHLNKDAEKWQIEILKEYGLYKENVG